MHAVIDHSQVCTGADCSHWAHEEWLKLKREHETADYKRGIRDALNECLRIQAPPNVRWNLQQLLQSEIPQAAQSEYAEGYSHGRQDCLREVAALLRTYGLFTGRDAAEAVEKVKR